MTHPNDSPTPKRGVLRRLARLFAAPVEPARPCECERCRRARTAPRETFTRWAAPVGLRPTDLDY